MLTLVFYPLRALATRFSFGESLNAEPYTISPCGYATPGQRDPFPAGVDGFHRIRFNVFFG